MKNNIIKSLALAVILAINVIAGHYAGVISGKIYVRLSEFIDKKI